MGGWTGKAEKSGLGSGTGDGTYLGRGKDFPPGRKAGQGIARQGAHRTSSQRRLCQLVRTALAAICGLLACGLWTWRGTVTAERLVQGVTGRYRSLAWTLENLEWRLRMATVKGARRIYYLNRRSQEKGEMGNGGRNIGRPVNLEFVAIHAPTVIPQKYGRDTAEIRISTSLRRGDRERDYATI